MVGFQEFQALGWVFCSSASCCQSPPTSNTNGRFDKGLRFSFFSFLLCAWMRQTLLLTSWLFGLEFWGLSVLTDQLIFVCLSDGGVNSCSQTPTSILYLIQASTSCHGTEPINKIVAKNEPTLWAWPFWWVNIRCQSWAIVFQTWYMCDDGWKWLNKPFASCPTRLAKCWASWWLRQSRPCQRLLQR